MSDPWLLSRSTPDTRALQAVARRQRLFTLGLAEWLAALLSGRPLLHGKLAPEPWQEV